MKPLMICIFFLLYGSLLSAKESSIRYIDPKKSIIDNVKHLREPLNQNYKNHRCIIAGQEELEQAVTFGVNLTGCYFATNYEVDFSKIWQRIDELAIKDIHLVSPIPSFEHILAFILPFMKKGSLVTILGSEDTRYLTDKVGSYIEENSGLNVQKLYPHNIPSLGSATRNIKGNLVLVIHDVEIMPTESHVKNFMKYMIRNSTPTIGLSPYFFELGGFIEFSKPSISAVQEALQRESAYVTPLAYQIEYIPLIIERMSLEKAIEGPLVRELN